MGHRKDRTHDQMGFIPGVQYCFYSHKSINVIYHVNRLKINIRKIISIDAEKEMFGTQHALLIKIFQ